MAATTAEAGTRRRGNTRGQIQQAALSRFTEQGYDKTSLREIAEDLGITKAAVYYHFRSKDEILESLMGEAMVRLDELVAWIREQPHTREVRLELIARLSAAASDGLGDLMRCVQVNETALDSLPDHVNLARRYKHELWEAATPPDASVADRLRFRLAVMAVLLASQGMADLGGTTQERSAAALEVATALMP
ncbi:TetR/AcrR family transcriptional regulator [Cellulomonas citrea]|uniref:TetR/AcrR family transcriptional regulator n=1 Tax=Cellulomonas citrea TaxID=1909423 RepID=UPI00135BDA2A|nr:TetR/AcrR family transcriptional regulator [Cellulomonas citrea]